MFTCAFQYEGVAREIKEVLTPQGNVFIFCTATQFGLWETALTKHAGVIVETAPFMTMYPANRNAGFVPPAACSTSAGMLALVAHKSTRNSTFNPVGDDGRVQKRAIYPDYKPPSAGERVMPYLECHSYVRNKFCYIGIGRSEQSHEDGAKEPSTDGVYHQEVL